ncbi:MAG: CHAD domain-containing protein [Planctomycetota bacterium]
MSYRLQIHEGLEAGVRRIAAEQLERALGELDSRDLESDEIVHQVRKRCKKIRGLLRLVRVAMGEQYRVENTAFRDEARKLSPIRDAQALTSTYDTLMERFDEQVDRSTFGPFRAAMTRRQKELSDRLADPAILLKEFREAMVCAKERVGSWRVAEGGFDVVGDGLERTYSRGRQAMKKARDSRVDEDWHEWRKRVKYHWYHTRVLEGVWPRVLDRWSSEIKRLSDLLGDDHDLAVLENELVDGCLSEVGTPRDRQVFAALGANRRADLQSEAVSLGAILYAESPGALRKRWKRWWKAAHRPPETGAGARPS